MNTASPLVSVLTPVYNGEKYLRACIESVLSQTYRNWNYVLVNNCSTDRTLEIAEDYARKDGRITVVTNPRFVGLVENHNIAFARASGDSKYCKIVSADDWLYPECIEKLVDFAEHHPTVSIVGSYAMFAHGIRWIGLPHDATVISGRDICRRYLLGDVDAFGTPSTLLYRSDLVRSRSPFFPGAEPSADLAACLACLRDCDFGFVHQILSFERIHDEAMNTKLRPLNSFSVDRIEFLAKFGSTYLKSDELAARTVELSRNYYAFLAASALNLREPAFWAYHRKRLEQVGDPLSLGTLSAAVSRKVFDLLLNPKQTIEKALHRLGWLRA